MNFCLGVLFSTSLANWRWLQGLFWWTLLYKMARLENQRSEGVGCDYDRMNTFFFSLTLPVVNRISIFYVVLPPRRCCSCEN